MLKRNALKLIAASALSISAAAVLTACSPDGPAFRGVNITGADYARDFSLTDHHGQLRSLARDRNSFSDSADYLACCQYKVEPIAAGAALPFIDEFIRTI